MHHTEFVGALIQHGKIRSCKENYTVRIRLLHCEMENIFTSRCIASPHGAVLSTKFQLHNEKLVKYCATLYLTRSTT